MVLLHVWPQHREWGPLFVQALGGGRAAGECPPRSPPVREVAAKGWEGVLALAHGAYRDRAGLQEGTLLPLPLQQAEDLSTAVAASSSPPSTLVASRQEERGMGRKHAVK